MLGLATKGHRAPGTEPGLSVLPSVGYVVMEFYLPFISEHEVVVRNINVHMNALINSV